ncbi:MAG: MMPL family transporter [Pseudomonadales bacterium]|nr:MMPL family transporter [Pseudomonadales bacterium]
MQLTTISTERLSEWIYNNNRKLSFVALVFYILAASGLYFSEFRSDFRAAFKEDSELIQTYDKINDQYEKGETLIFYLKLSNSGSISTENINAIQYADNITNTLPYVRYVRSLTSFQKPFADEDSINSKYIGDWAKESNGLLGVNQYLPLQTQLLGTLITEDYSGAIVIAQLDLPEPLYKSSSKLMTAAEKAAIQIEQANPNVEVSILGTVAIDDAFLSEFYNFLIFGTPAIIFFVSLVVAWSSSSPYVTMSGLATAGISLITVGGIFGWLPVYFDQTAIMGALLVMLLTVLDCIHIGVTYRVCLSNSLNKEEAIKESIRVNLLPVFYTTLTTGVGLITMLITGSPPYVLFAQIALVGITAGFIYSFIFMTSLSILLPEPKNGKTPSEPLVNFARDITLAKPKRIIATFLLITVTALFLISLNTVDEDIGDILKPGNETDIAIELMQTNFKASNQLLVNLSSADDQPITSPKITSAINNFEKWLDSDPTVEHTFSVNDVIKEMKSTWDNQPHSNQLPQSREEYEQLLLLYEMSLQAGQSASEFISPDRSQTLLTVFLENQTNRDLLIKKKNIEQWWVQQDLGVSVSISGQDIIFSQLAEETVHSSILGGGIAAMLITLFMIFSFQSIKWGLFSIIPNAVPFILLFGIWGLLSGEISQATCMAFSMVIGIVVDDSIHFITKFREAKKTLAFESALTKTYDYVGTAITVGTVAFIVDGILIYLASEFVPIAIIGTFILLTFIFAWLCDMLLMPAILVVYYQRKENQLSYKSV